MACGPNTTGGAKIENVGEEGKRGAQEGVRKGEGEREMDGGGGGRELESPMCRT